VLLVLAWCLTLTSCHCDADGVVSHGVQAVGAAIDAVAPHAQLIETGAADVRRLCKWLGTKGANTRFNNLMRYVLTESAPTARTPPSAPMATSAQCPLTAWHGVRGCLLWQVGTLLPLRGP
jgi:hypothetical protein